MCCAEAASHNVCFQEYQKVGAQTRSVQEFAVDSDSSGFQNAAVSTCMCVVLSGLGASPSPPHVCSSTCTPVSHIMRRRSVSPLSSRSPLQPLLLPSLPLSLSLPSPHPRNPITSHTHPCSPPSSLTEPHGRRVPTVSTPSITPLRQPLVYGARDRSCVCDAGAWGYVACMYRYYRFFGYKIGRDVWGGLFFGGKRGQKQQRCGSQPC